MLVVLAALGLLKLRSTKELPPPAPVDPVYSQLTGQEIPVDVADRPILGVMIENSEAARPQAGLSSAGIVYETLTEGGITRYLALYQEDMPDVVGPVRSLRPIFLEAVMGFDASIAHVGGSPEALELVDQRNAKSLNQFSYDEPYYRDANREAPHNMYARTQALRDLQAELGHSKSKFVGSARNSDSPVEKPVVRTITIDFSLPEFRVQFRYDPLTNQYARFLAGEPDVDSATNKQISVKNIVVIKTVDKKSSDSGEALVFRDGKVVKARWQKADYNQQLTLIDQNNNEVALNRGHSWFAFVPMGRAVDY